MARASETQHNRSGYNFQDAVFYTRIFEPSNFPVSVYKLLWNLMLLEWDLLVIICW